MTAGKPPRGAGTQLALTAATILIAAAAGFGAVYVMARGPDNAGESDKAIAGQPTMVAQAGGTATPTAMRRAHL